MNVTLPTEMPVRAQGRATGGAADEKSSDPFSSFLNKEDDKAGATDAKVENPRTAKEAAAVRWHARTQVPAELQKDGKALKDALADGLDVKKETDTEEEQDPRALLQDLIQVRKVEQTEPKGENVDADAAAMIGQAADEATAQAGVEGSGKLIARLDGHGEEASAGHAAAADAAGARKGTAAKTDKDAADGRPGAQTAAQSAAAAEADAAHPASATAAPADAPKPVDETAAKPERTAAPEAKRAAEGAATPADAAAPRVTVVSTQTAMAPAVGPAPAMPMSETGTALVSALGDGPVAQYITDTQATGMAAANDQRPMTTLKLQLHPAELGQVTITMASRGEHLSIEARVETSEARNRLTHDRDAIVQALRGMGYDIDRITVQQSQNTGASPGGAGRDGSFGGQTDGRGERQYQSSGRDQGRQAGDQHAQRESQRGSRADGAGSGVYI